MIRPFFEAEHHAPVPLASRLARLFQIYRSCGQRRLFAAAMKELTPYRKAKRDRLRFVCRYFRHAFDRIAT
jgi:hypothetical protein